MALSIKTKGLTSGGKAGVAQKAFDWLFGYDYFIAHRSADGKAYASALYDTLTGKGNELDCFLDVKHYGAGGNLTNMQTRALKKATRLVVIVTRQAHDDDAIYLRSEVGEFRRTHPNGIIAPIGTVETLSEKHYPKSQLLPLLPHLPNAICILEPAGPHVLETPSPQTVAKLLNDFSEERRSSKRLRWIRRAALLLLMLLIATLWFWRDAATANNSLVQETGRAYLNTAIQLNSERRCAEAVGYYARALELIPRSASARLGIWVCVAQHTWALEAKSPDQRAARKKAMDFHFPREDEISPGFLVSRDGGRDPQLDLWVNGTSPQSCILWTRRESSRETWQ
jgi:hypothetical protein